VLFNQSLGYIFVLMSEYITNVSDALLYANNGDKARSAVSLVNACEDGYRTVSTADTTGTLLATHSGVIQIHFVFVFS